MDGPKMDNGNLGWSAIHMAQMGDYYACASMTTGLWISESIIERCKFKFMDEGKC